MEEVKRPALPGNQCYRQSGKALLLDYIQRLRQRADEMEALSKILPDDPKELPEGADEALWELLAAGRRL